MSEENISDIVVPKKRARRLHDFTSLAESMREIGLLHPITITNEKVLISGLHRLRAAESLGWQTIEVKVLTGDELDTELAEIDENLMSHHLTVAEQSEHIARRDALLKARGARAAVGGDRPSEADSNFDPVTVTGSKEKTTEELAKDAGMSKSSYEKRVKIGHGLAVGTLAILNDLDPSDCDLPNSTRQLNYLAGVDSPEDQEEIARRVATGEAVSVWQASDQLKEERGEETTNGSKTMQEAHERWMEGGKEKDDEPRTIVRIKKVFAEYNVEWSDGKSSRVTRRALSDHGLKNHLCTHCGVGVARKENS